MERIADKLQHALSQNHGGGCFFDYVSDLLDGALSGAAEGFGPIDCDDAVAPPVDRVQAAPVSSTVTNLPDPMALAPCTRPSFHRRLRPREAPPGAEPFPLDCLPCLVADTAATAATAVAAPNELEVEMDALKLLPAAVPELRPPSTPRGSALGRRPAFRRLAAESDKAQGEPLSPTAWPVKPPAPKSSRTSACPRPRARILAPVPNSMALPVAETAPGMILASAGKVRAKTRRPPPLLEFCEELIATAPQPPATPRGASRPCLHLLCPARPPPLALELCSEGVADAPQVPPPPRRSTHPTTFLKSSGPPMLQLELCSAVADGAPTPPLVPRASSAPSSRLPAPPPSLHLGLCEQTSGSEAVPPPAPRGCSRPSTYLDMACEETQNSIFTRVDSVPPLLPLRGRAEALESKPMPTMSAMALDLGGEAPVHKVRSCQSHHRSSSEMRFDLRLVSESRKFTSGKSKEPSFLPTIAGKAKTSSWRSLSLERSDKAWDSQSAHVVC
mmetsp:Transcript_5097/g.10491  ORF Transcript_5097/g.10491 Transcript_5097/m.10491 type:complete len:502 (-) Transcript_5097:42-1547(-)